MKKLFYIGLVSYISLLIGRGYQMALDKNYYEGWFI